MQTTLPETVVPIQNIRTFTFTPTDPVVRQGIFVYGHAVLPPHNIDTDFLVKGVLDGNTLNTSTPNVVLLQARQSENRERGFLDQFALQVIETGRDFIRFLVRRIDKGSDRPHGWGQQLRIDVLVIDDAAAP